MVATAENPTSNQTFGNRRVTIIRNSKTGERAAKITETGHQTYYVPVDILGIAAGKDAWMRDIKVRCGDCRTKVVKASELECGMCPECYEKAGEENARLDGR